MAARSINDSLARCKSCAAFDVVSLTFQRCALHDRPILGEDLACADIVSNQPWANWLLTAPSVSPNKGRRENML